MLSKQYKDEIRKILNVIGELQLDLSILENLPARVTQIPEEIKLNGMSKKVLVQLFTTEQMYETKPTKELITTLKSQTLSAVSTFKKNKKFIDSVKNDLSKKKKERIHNIEEVKRNINITNFQGVMSTYRELLSDKIHLSSEEFSAQKKLKKKLQHDTKKAKADIKALKNSLMFEQTLRKNDVATLDGTIKSFVTQVQNCKRQADMLKRDFVAEYQDNDDQSRNMFLDSRRGLTDRIKKLRTELFEMKKNHAAVEQALKVNRRNFESKLKDNVEMYQEMVEYNTTELEFYIKAYKGDEKRMEFLEKGVEELREEREFADKTNLERRNNLTTHLNSIQAFSEGYLLLVSALRSRRRRKKIEGMKRRRRREFDQTSSTILMGYTVNSTVQMDM